MTHHIRPFAFLLSHPIKRTVEGARRRLGPEGPLSPPPPNGRTMVMSRRINNALSPVQFLFFDQVPAVSFILLPDLEI